MYLGKQIANVFTVASPFFILILGLNWLLRLGISYTLNKFHSLFPSTSVSLFGESKLLNEKKLLKKCHIQIMFIAAHPCTLGKFILILINSNRLYWWELTCLLFTSLYTIIYNGDILVLNVSNESH